MSSGRRWSGRAPFRRIAGDTLRRRTSALGKVYDKNMAPFAEALSKYVASRDNAAQQQARRALRDFAAAVRAATKDSRDAQVWTDGEKAAGQLRARSTDKAFFTRPQTATDVNTVLGPTLTQWLSPVQSHCS